MQNKTILRASSAGRRVLCPASYKMETKYPSVQNVYAAEGVTAHKVAENYLNGQEFNKDIKDVDETTYAEMIDGAKYYASVIAQITHGARVRTETYVRARLIDEYAAGTVDAWAYDEQTHALYVFDYKFGFSRVEAFENWQMLVYAAGIMDLIKRDVHDIVLCIVQPRIFARDRHDVWRITIAQAQGYFAIMRAQNEKALSEKPEFVPGVKQCKYCSARAHCAALQTAAYDAIEITRRSQDFKLSPQALGVELKRLEDASALLDARVSGLQQEAISHIQKGESIPFYRLEQGFGREKWKLDAATIKTMGSLFGVDLSKPLDVITPKQAIAKGLDEAVVRGYSETPLGETKLARVDARKIFKE